MNNNLEICRTPGNTPGAYVSLRTELRKIMEKRSNIPENIKIKISGDGTKVSRISNYVVISFSLIDQSAKLSSNEQVVLAIVKTSEQYDTLDTCFSPVFREINEITSAGEIEFQDRKIKLEVFFGGDMKFLQICLGLGSSTGEFACPWCKIPKHERCDTTKVWDYYHSEDIKRTIKEITDLSKLSKKQFGVKHKPLIIIEPSHIVPDELHLLLRIFDVLLRNLIDDATDKDVKEQARTRKLAKDNITELVEKIRSCGVTFAIWSSKAGDTDWTSLTGNAVKKVLRNLPDKLFFIIHNDTHEDTVQLWKDFSAIYDFICSDLCETKDAHSIYTQCKQWVDKFLSLGDKRKGYAKKNITPYIHCLLYHVPYFIVNYGSLRKFSGQPTEKVNDDIKAIHHKKTNRYDCAMDALTVRKRIEANHNSGREKRSYNKKKSEYWEDEIRLIRSRRKLTICAAIKDADVIPASKPCLEHEIDVENFTVVEIKQKLKDHGVATKIRKHDKLVQLYKDTVLQNHS
ncbi:unnamed protein product [Mytilus edulis]|uniref:SAP domain-containing protein n=1 Tax=Mytilus edulis TaxID=6550 RepID=A0A8S3S7G1_MYTED|nr:unnamed protein product [Mytilus edulis]